MTRSVLPVLLLAAATGFASAQTPSFKPLAVQPTRSAPAAQPAPAATQPAPAAAHPSFKPLATQPTRPASGASAASARTAPPVRPAP
ncbi:MAG: AraC family transcriptional regulator, partial [Kiritimatiellae bacterium]|nr:AraC family transcriptional regulator [Kiritimatiellia bacterium]